MRFRKLDEKTICCMLSEEDLTDNDITIEDFIHNRDNVQYFLEEIIETAREEVGFEASGPMLSIQIMAMYPEGVMITFSDNPKGMTNAIKAGLAQVKGEVDDAEWIEAGTLDMPKKSYTQKKSENAEKLIAVFEFSSMEAIFSFVKNTSVRSGLDSSLYKEEKTGKYYMALIKVRMSEERYRALIATAMEFGDFTADTGLQYAQLQEHCRCMIKEKAVNVLKKVSVV
ncbi:MAG: adaptor protein MecA [Lachnospiraceae bacterium]|nr:adaptor protein MecA [Lachnospiraceae bacterium]MCI8826539.1 adaptor protein MecA [Lachnospiraceae bacterium]MCI9369056.1 adaptor protein MecA [Lachnospiraceae bacterium]